MRQMAEGMLHDDERAADAVQEVLVRLWHRRWRLGLMSDTKSYCLRTLRNYCIDLIRHSKQRERTLMPNEIEALNLADGDEGHDDELQYQALEKALRLLPQQQQKVIELKYVKQLSIHEIAQQTGLSETNVTTLLSRAYASLRKKIGNEIDNSTL